MLAISKYSTFNIILALGSVSVLITIALFVLLQIISLRAIRRIRQLKTGQIVPHSWFPIYSFLQLFVLERQEKPKRVLDAQPNRIFAVSMFNLKPLVIIDEATECMHVLAKTKEFRRLSGSDFFVFAMPEEFSEMTPTKGLLTTEHVEWIKQRKLLNPTFDQQHVDRMVEAFRVCVRRLVQDRWKSGDTVDVVPDARSLTLDVIAKAGFGMDFDLVRKGKNQLARSFETITNELAGNPLVFLPGYLQLPLPHLKRLRAAMREVNSTMYRLITEKLAKLESSPTAAVETEEEADLLGLMLRQSLQSEGGSLSNKAIKDNLFTLIFAGHETSSITLSYLIYYLAKHQDVQQRCYQEILRVSNGCDEPSAEMLSQMTLITDCINETLRLNPPAPVLVRSVKQSGLAVCGYNLPEGAAIAISIRSMHLLEDYWGTDAHVWNPDRWSRQDSISTQRPQGSFMAFGYGGHVCIGRQFAMQELRVATAMILSSYKLTLIDENFVPKLANSGSMRPVSVPIKLEARK